MINFTLLSKHITILNNNVICYELTSYLRCFNTANSRNYYETAKIHM